jgi:hypothetical protein
VSSSSASISTPPSGQVRDAAGGVQTLAPGYGEQTASTLGQTSSSYGTTASNHGQTASSLGQTASSYGTASSSTGQTAGGFGNSLGTIAQAGQAGGAKAPHVFEAIAPKLEEMYPELRTQLSMFDADQLLWALKGTLGSRSYPDLLIFVGFPADWPGPAAQVREMEAAHVGDVAAERVLKTGDSRRTVDCLALRRAPHAGTARAFVAYLDAEGGWSAPAQ